MITQLALPHAHRWHLDDPQPGRERTNGTCTTCGVTRDCGSSYEPVDGESAHRTKGLELQRKARMERARANRWPNEKAPVSEGLR